MSQTTFNINTPNLYTHNGVSLVIGEMDVHSDAPNSINLPSIETDNCHVILSKYNFSNFKNQINTAPLTNKAIYVYDNFCNRVARYESDRKSNGSGELNILTDQVILLSNIIFPKTGETIYLPLSSYKGFTDVLIPEMRWKLLEQDLIEMGRKTNLSKIHIIINNNLFDQIKQCMPRGSLLPFEKISVINDCDDLISFLIQYICGKTISGQESVFQGMLNFGNDFEIISAKSFLSDKKSNQNKIKLMPRTNGIVQLNLEGSDSKTRFIIMLNNKSTNTLSVIKETTTDTTHPIYSKRSSTKQFENCNVEIINKFIDLVKYNSTLQSFGNKILETDFIKSTPVETMTLLFVNLEDTSEHSNMYTNIIRSEYTKLIANNKQIIINLINGNPSTPLFGVQKSAYNAYLNNDDDNDMYKYPPASAPINSAMRLFSSI